jgi:tryptophan 2,3-dioxygenase
MTTRTSPPDSVADSILHDIASYRASASSLPTRAAEALPKLIARGLEVDDIERRRAAFATFSEVDDTAVLSNYELLHGTPFLDRSAQGKCASLHGGTIVTLFRAAEICLQNLAVLAARVALDVRSGDLGQAAVKFHWINHFHTTLYSLSRLLTRSDPGYCDGTFLDIRDSCSWSDYERSKREMHACLRHEVPENASNIANNDIDDPQRFVYFNAYVNENYELIWRSAFERSRIPGAEAREGESPAQTYQRIVQPDQLERAVHSVDLREVTYLMQFRAYHQISEVLVKFVNETASDVIVHLLSRPEAPQDEAADALAICTGLLAIVTDNIRPIVRTLSPNAYFAIRPALGTTSGSHSHNLRKGLFLTVYPALVKALRLWIGGFDDDHAASDAQTLARAKDLLANRRYQPEARLIRSVVDIHQAIRVWRDEHMQFVKTQIGVSSADEAPTASISGAENAAATADRFRLTHNADPIAPLFEAVLGRALPAALPMITPGGFDEYMAHLTADAVRAMYADVQARVQRKRVPA